MYGFWQHCHPRRFLAIPPSNLKNSKILVTVFIFLNTLEVLSAPLITLIKAYLWNISAIVRSNPFQLTTRYTSCFSLIIFDKTFWVLSVPYSPCITNVSLWIMRPSLVIPAWGNTHTDNNIKSFLYSPCSIFRITLIICYRRTYTFCLNTSSSWWWSFLGRGCKNKIIFTVMIHFVFWMYTIKCL